MSWARKYRSGNEYAPVAQLDRVADFESAGRRFESCRARRIISGPLAQLVEQQTLNLRVEGSIPSRLIPMTKDEADPGQIPGRIKELREILEIPVADMAADTGIPLETYTAYENGEHDIPISALYSIASRLGTDVTVLMTVEDPKMESAAVCRKGKGVRVERYPGYEYSSLAYNFKGRTMEPLQVYLDPSKPQAEPVVHHGQEFNFVIAGKVKITIANTEHILGAGDSIYFDARLPHRQCAVDGSAEFITLIQE